MSSLNVPKLIMMKFSGEDGRSVVEFHSDGKIVVGDHVTADEAAKKVIEALTMMWGGLYHGFADAERERCAKLAAEFPARTHGSLPTDPHEAAAQVASEIAASIRALSKT